MPTLNRIRYLTKHYQDLQGHRLLPFSAAFLIIAANAIWLHTSQVGQTSAFSFWQSTKGLPVTVLLLAFAASHLIGKYYESRYGRVTPAPGAPLAFHRTTYGVATVLALLLELLSGQPAAGLSLTWLWLTITQIRMKQPTGKRHVSASIIYLLIAIVLTMTRHGATDLQNFNYAPLAVWSLLACAITTLAAIHNHRVLLALRSEATAEEAA